MYVFIHINIYIYIYICIRHTHSHNHMRTYNIHTCTHPLTEEVVDKNYDYHQPKTPYCVVGLSPTE